MFTGIIETLAKVERITPDATNVHFELSSAITAELRIDQSVAHNGVCLTVVEIKDNIYKVTAIRETLERSNLSELKEGDVMNIERCMPANGRFDGHIVQGHVDTTALCTGVHDLKGSYEFVFMYDEQAGITVEKGSITVNGVSLTVVRSAPGLFSVCIIPYTMEHTTFRTLDTGQKVNIEFDIVGKYVARLMSKNATAISGA